MISSYELGLTLPEVIAMRGYTLFKAGAPLDGLVDLDSAVLASPLNPLFQTYLGERLLAQDKLALALNHLDNANILDPDLGLAYLIRSKLFLSLGIEVSAKEALDASIGFSLPNSKDYVDRGQLRTFFGDFDLAFSDLNEAIRISPNQAGYYNTRGISYAKFDDYRSAINDFTVAIEKDNTIAEYLINRGVANDIIGEIEFSSADFENAKSVDNIEIPLPKNRNAAYFKRSQVQIEP
jgi:tetratricopeptide (TPR) repeat protein